MLIIVYMIEVIVFKLLQKGSMQSDYVLLMSGLVFPLRLDLLN